MTKDEALKLALEALEVANSCVDGYYIPKGRTQLPEIELALTAIKEALAQPEQEPVAFMFQHDEVGRCVFSPNDSKDPVDTFLQLNPRYHLVGPLYTTPPQRTWVGLTDVDIQQMGLKNYIKVVRETEAKLKELNS